MLVLAHCSRMLCNYSPVLLHRHSYLENKNRCWHNLGVSSKGLASLFKQMVILDDFLIHEGLIKWRFPKMATFTFLKKCYPPFLETSINHQQRYGTAARGPARWTGDALEPRVLPELAGKVGWAASGTQNLSWTDLELRKNHRSNA